MLPIIVAGSRPAAAALAQKRPFNCDTSVELHQLRHVNITETGRARISISSAGLPDPVDFHWARRFFENWRASLKWQRLAPYEKFAGMIDRHWDGIAAYCKPENKVSLGFVEGLNNKIRVIQRRAYGLRDQEYLRLKVLTCMLPAL
jgi:transposase